MTPSTDAGTLPAAIHSASSTFTVRSVRWRAPPTSFVPAEYSRSVPTAATAETLKTLIRTGAISDPAPMPVAPTRMPTSRPASDQLEPCHKPLPGSLHSRRV